MLPRCVRKVSPFMSMESSSFGQAPACVRRVALDALRIAEPAAKAARVRALHDALRAGQAAIAPSLQLREPADLPGRPARPPLVEPRQLERRSMRSPEGRAVLLHALAHIEFNAINLALDAVWRFAGMPDAFYADWLKVAAEEAYHFTLLSDRLAAFGHAYGDFPAHNGLWEMCERTRDDVLARIVQAGDDASAAILDVILRDEIGHVAIGNRWFRHLCDAAGRDPVPTYRQLAEQYHAPRLRGPFNFDARRDAGFEQAELDELAAQDAADGRAAH